MTNNVVARLLVQLGIVTGPLTKGIKKVEGEMLGLQATLQKHGRTASRSFAAIGAGIGVGLGYAAHAAVKFEDEMNRVATVTNASTKQMQQMEDMVFNLSETYGVSAHKIAQGMEEMARRGFSAEKVMKAFPSILKATVASGEDFNTVLRTTEALLLEFQMDADKTSKVVDVLSKASVKTAANFSKMGEAFKYSAPVAYQLGISLEDLAAATATMINSGIQGSSAGRLLGSGLQRLVRPPKMAAQALKELSVQIVDQTGNMLPLRNIIRQIHDSTRGMGNAQRAAYVEMIFGKEAAKALLTVIEKGPDAFDKLSDSLKDTAGFAQGLADKMGKSTKKQFERLKATVEKLTISFGKHLIPRLSSLMAKLKRVADWFNNLSPTIKKIITLTLEWVSALAFLLAALTSIGRIAKYIIAPIAVLRSMFGKVAIAAGAAGAAGMLGFLGRALSVLGGPVGMAIGALSLLFPVLSSLSSDYDKVKKEIEDPPKPKPVEIKVKITGPMKKDLLGKNPLQKFWEKPVTIPPPNITEYEKRVKRVKELNKELKENTSGALDELYKLWDNLLTLVSPKMKAYEELLDENSETTKRTNENQKESWEALSTFVSLLWEGMKRKANDWAISIRNGLSTINGWIGKLIEKINEFNGTTIKTGGFSTTPAQNRAIFGPTFGTGGNNTTTNHYTFNTRATTVDRRSITNQINRARRVGGRPI